MSPVAVKMQSTLTRESSGLYTVSSTLFAHVTREDRHSLYHCSVHYRLRGQRRTAESRRVNITVFCESGAAAVGTVGQGWMHSERSRSLLPQTPQST